MSEIVDWPAHQGYTSEELRAHLAPAGYGPFEISSPPDGGGSSPCMPGAQTFTPWAIFHAHSSNLHDVVQDSSAPNAGYASVSAAWSSSEADTTPGGPAYPAKINLPIWLGKADGVSGRPTPGSPPYGGYQGHFLIRKGPDTPTYQLRAASAVVAGVLENPWSASLVWKNIKTGDLYAASSSWLSVSFFALIQGADGDQMTSYSSGSGAIDGGQGLYYFAFFRTGKNASSSDYILDIAEFGVSGVAL